MQSTLALFTDTACSNKSASALSNDADESADGGSTSAKGFG